MSSSCPKKDDEHLTGSVDGESVAISLREAIDSVKHVLTPAKKEPLDAVQIGLQAHRRIAALDRQSALSSGPARGT